MKKIFILEDDPERHRWFRLALSHLGEITIVTSVKEALRVYPTGTWDLVCLDHDLDESHYGLYMDQDDARYRYEMSTVDPQTGFHFALWLSQKAPVPTVIHTANPAGGEAMKKLLPHAVRESFFRMRKDPFPRERGDFLLYAAGVMLTHPA